MTLRARHDDPSAVLRVALSKSKGDTTTRRDDVSVFFNLNSSYRHSSYRRGVVSSCVREAARGGRLS
jgi:hypothetical protein